MKTLLLSCITLFFLVSCENNTVTDPATQSDEGIDLTQKVYNVYDSINSIDKRHASIYNYGNGVFYFRNGYGFPNFTENLSLFLQKNDSLEVTSSSVYIFDNSLRGYTITTKIKTSPQNLK